MNLLPENLALAQLSERRRASQHNELRYRLAAALRHQQRAERAMSRARRLMLY
jgi:hypothetical protein